ncbi:MAG: ATP-binding cassette domain-containing protein [Wenzhouxiangellaceae bacterium]
MVRIDEITLCRGSECLLEGASLTLHAGQKAGLIGANGTGKSSLFDALLGRLEVDAGSITVPDHWTIAHMAQQIDDLDRPAIEYVLDGDARLRHAEAELAAADAAGDGPRIAAAHQALADAGGFDATARAGSLLNGLGFGADQQRRTVGDFSGGWRIRLSLARALMSPSDLLLLDEPTNHLDLETILWLEGWLKRYTGTLLLISHDRDFLDNVVDQIVHLEHRKLYCYTGGYSAFEHQRAERLAVHQARYEKQQRQIEHLRTFVDRFRAKASKARQAQARLKALERMERLAPAHADSPFNFAFPQAPRVADPLLRLDRVTLGYGNTVVLEALTLNLSAGDRIGLLGVNGAGKSTLVKALAGTLKPIAGTIHHARNLVIGYFAQHQLEQINSALSPLAHLARIAGDAPEQALRDFLGGFAFSGDLASDPAARLSGGERARLVLALIIWQAPNLLLLDEPTNHLDLEMRHALTLALQGFDGAVVTVSHDRHLLEQTVDEYWLVADGRVQPWPQGLPAYREHTRATERGSSHLAERNGGQRKAERRRRASERERLKPLTDRVRKLTDRIDVLESRRRQLATELADPALYEQGSAERLRQLVTEDGALKSELEALELQWIEAEEALHRASTDTG